MSAGSHATWTPGQPRECAGCGKKLRITRDAPLWLDTFNLRSWCFPCKLAQTPGPPRVSANPTPRVEPSAVTDPRTRAWVEAQPVERERRFVADVVGTFGGTTQVTQVTHGWQDGQEHADERIPPAPVSLQEPSPPNARTSEPMTRRPNATARYPSDNHDTHAAPDVPPSRFSPAVHRDVGEARGEHVAREGRSA